MYKIIDKIETLFWKFVKYIIVKGWGTCEESDGEPFMSQGRCASCDATEVVRWIDRHIELINM